MSIFSKIIQKQCLKEYEEELFKQHLSFAQWREAQPAFNMQEDFAHAAVLYGDYMGQDSVSGKGQEPVFLPDFSPNRWDYEDYLGRAVYIHKDLYEQIDWDKTSRRAGLKRVMELATKERAVSASAQGSTENRAGLYGHIVHIRSLLEGDIPGFVKLDKLPGRGNFETVNGEQLREAISQGISIVIPSKDHPDILQKCLQSIEKTTGDIPLEIIIVDNGSCKENRVRVEAMCKFTTEGTGGRVTCQYLYEPMEFHFSKMCNLGAAKADGAYVLFLNDDIEAVESGWLTRMLSQAVKPFTGAVGMKLLYPDGERIQHAGIVNLPMGPVHKLQFASDKEVYYDKRNRGVHNVCAVTGACLMMRKALFEALGGMCLELPIAFNDVEICFHAMEEGYYNVVCCDSFLLHHESISRGQDNTEEKRSRLLRERSKLYELHPKQASFDAFYPYDTTTGYGLCHAYLDTAIRPAYEDGRPKVQVAENILETDRQKERTFFPQKPEHDKLNPCLKLTVEQLYQEEAEYIHVAGYGFVAGSDNSNFAYTLVLRGEQRVYGIPLERVRRNDLERNMPDQLHVGLAGFHVKLPMQKLKGGRYRVELYAKDRTSGLRLRQKSNVYFTV